MVNIIGVCTNNFASTEEKMQMSNSIHPFLCISKNQWSSAQRAATLAIFFPWWFLVNSGDDDDCFYYFQK